MAGTSSHSLDFNLGLDYKKHRPTRIPSDRSASKGCAGRRRACCKALGGAAAGARPFSRDPAPGDRPFEVGPGHRSGVARWQGVQHGPPTYQTRARLDLAPPSHQPRAATLPDKGAGSLYPGGNDCPAGR